MPDFSKYLQIDVGSVDRPKPLPLGHFFATIRGWKTAERDFDKANGGPKTPVVELTFGITGPDDDVEVDDLPEGGVAGKLATRDYRLNDPDRSGIYQVRRLAEETCGLDVKGHPLEDVLDALKGQEVKVYNEPRPGREEGEFFTNIKRVLPAHG